MKRKSLIFCLAALILTSAHCAEIPKWLKNTEAEFPDSLYIKSVGEGASAKKSQNDALSNISLFFDTKIDYVKYAVEETKEIVVGDKAFFASSESYQNLTRISSSAEFFCVKFTETYFDKKSDTYFVLAYINKKEAAQIYRSRIDALMLAVNGYRSQAQGESEPFLAAQSLHKAEAISRLAAQYTKNETTIVPADSEKYKEQLAVIALIPSERAALKKQLSFSIIMNQKGKRYDPLFSTVASVLEKYGYSYSLADSNYKIIIDMTCAEESAEAGEFVRPSLDVLIVNGEGGGVYSYSKAYPRTGGKSLEQAYTRAVSKAKQDLEEHFLAE